MHHNHWRHPSILIVGGFDLAQSAWSIARGFEAVGWRYCHFPSRGRMVTHREHDDRNRRGESRQYDKAVVDSPDCANEVEFTYRLMSAVREHRPRILLWWTCKEDKPKRCISVLRTEFPGLATVFQTQDDPWHAERHPEYSDEFEFAVTCCDASHPAYTKRGVFPITLYPPPDEDLCRAAQVRPEDECDISFAPGHLQDRRVWPQQFVDRKQIVTTLMPLGKCKFYGSWRKEAKELGVAADSWMDWREFEKLPDAYRSAKVNVNVHLRPDADGYLNKRALETVAAGGFMLCDHVKGIERVYHVNGHGYSPEDCEIDTWRNLNELHDKVRFWLEHDAERQAAAVRGQERILAEWGNRAGAQKLIGHIEEHGK